MKLSARLMFWGSLLFAALCLAYAYLGFSAIDPSMSEEMREASRGYAWFWTFLGVIGVALAAVARWMRRRTDRDE
jgi:amino acid transporter